MSKTAKAVQPDSFDAAITVRDITEALSFRIARLAAINERVGGEYFQNAFNLRINEWRVLGLAVAGSPASFASVRSMLLIDKGQLSRTVKALVERGVLETRACASDARQIELHPTTEGLALHDKVLVFTAERNAAMASSLNPEEYALFDQLLDRLLQDNAARLNAKDNVT